VGNEVKYLFTLFVAGNAGKGGGLISFNFNFEIFYSGSEASMGHSKISCGTIIFRHSPVAP
jgi:hypothetical protein